MAGTPDGILAHTQSSRGGNRYWYNGRECGEIAQSALTYGSVGIPVVMVSGDAATCREAREFLGDAVVTVSVKEGYGEQFGALVPPLAAHTLLREGACEAMARVAQCHLRHGDPDPGPPPLSGQEHRGWFSAGAGHGG